TLSRNTYSPSFVGSPATTENCAPFGNAGGAGPHFSWSAETAICSSSAIAKTDAEPTSKAVVSKIVRNMSGLPNYSLCLLRLPQRQPKKSYSNLDGVTRATRATNHFRACHQRENGKDPSASAQCRLLLLTVSWPIVVRVVAWTSRYCARPVSDVLSNALDLCAMRI